MHKRTISARSGRCQPAVAWGIAWPARLRTYPHTIVGRVTRSGGREPAVSVGNARAGMITPRFRQRRCTRGTGAAGVTPPWLQEPRLQRQFRTHSDTVVAHAPRAAGVNPPSLALTHLQRRFRHCSEDCRPACWRTPLQPRCRNPGGLRPPALVPECAFVQRKSRFFTVRRTTCVRSGGREPAVCRADVLAQALPQLLGRLSPVGWRTPLQSRSCNRGG